MTTGLPGKPAGGSLGFAASTAGLASQAAPSCEPVTASTNFLLLSLLGFDLASCSDNDFFLILTFFLI